MNVSDIIISRSGAMTITEISNLGKPSILIPLPNVSQDHQLYNAKALENVGASKIILNDELTGEKLNTNIERANNSYRNIEHFSEAYSCGFLSLGKAFTEKIISPIELLNKLNDNNSQKFRKWLSEIPENTQLTGEFYNECEARLSQKWITKIIRFCLTTAAGFLPVISVPVSALDQFVVDRMIDGWKPKIFLDKILRDKKLSAK